ncbi:ankyrin repeat domain-containing protein [Acidobacteriota bacterium]
MKKKIILLICVFLSVVLIQAQSQDILASVLSGDIEQVKRLLDKDPGLIHTKDEYKNSLFYRALLKDDFEMAKLLLEKGIDVNYAREDFGGNELIGAIGIGSMEMIELIVKYGADINVKTRSGITPLLGAIYEGQKDIAYFFLDKGAVLDADASHSESLVRACLTGGMDRILDVIMKDQSIDLLSTDDIGNTFLHAAAEGGVISFVPQLLEQGIDIDAKNIYGWTPLHYAASSGHDQMIGFLLEKGASKNIRTNDGKSPYNVAQESNRKETRKYLVKFGVETRRPQFPVISAKYVDPVLPGTDPRHFAAGIVSHLKHFEHCYLTFSADLSAVCWSDWVRNGASRVFLMEKDEGNWKTPQVVVGGTNPCLSPDGNKIIFTMKRFLVEGRSAPDNDIFMIEKVGSLWGPPVNLGPNINSDSDDSQPSIAANGTIYFRHDADIYRSRFIDGRYMPKEKLPKPINTDNADGEPFIAADESFLIFRSMGAEGMRGSNIYISFLKDEDSWSPRVNLAEKMKLNGLFTSITPDKKYVFYFRDDFFWLDAQNIEELNR